MSDLVEIAVDAMGGDRAPDAIVQGSLDALAAYDDISIQLVGREDALRPLLKKASYLLPSFLRSSSSVAQP